jgi:chorismate synthase
MIAIIRQAKKDGDSLGGAVEVVARGVVPGLGSHVESDRKLDARLGGAMMGIQSVKAVEIGHGLATYRLKGYESHDALLVDEGKVLRETNFAGGIEGSMTNGEDIVINLYAKPIPTSLKRLPSFDLRSMRAKLSPFVRSDVCVLPALGVIAEAVMAWELLDAMCEKFGTDSVDDMRANYEQYMARIRKRGYQR